MKPRPLDITSGQESVWDYPRPPRLERTNAHIQIYFENTLIADSTRTRRVLETGHPPVYYIPPEHVQMQYLSTDHGLSLCEWKGLAHYFSLRVNDRFVKRAAWYYPEPSPAFQSIKNLIAFYPAPLDRCLVNGEKVRPQAGGFYGGWITDNISGPFKGDVWSLFSGNCYSIHEQ